MKTFTYTTKCRTLLGDLYTPVGVYMRLRDIYPQSALLESSDYHGNDNSRSFIGIKPIASLKIGHGMIDCSFPDGSHERKEVENEKKGEAKQSVADAISRFISRFKVTGEGAEYFGLYGYTSFNAVR